MNIRDFCNELKERAHELDQMIQFCKKRCMISCNGYLLARNDRGVDRYYEVINSSGARIYLGNNQKEKIKALEELFYYKKLCETAERELKQIEKALNDFSKPTDL